MALTSVRGHCQPQRERNKKSLNNCDSLHKLFAILVQLGVEDGDGGGCGVRPRLPGLRHGGTSPPSPCKGQP